MPIEQAIKEHRFAYGRQRHLVSMDQPPGTPPIDIVSAPVAELFERAFARRIGLSRPAVGGRMGRGAGWAGGGAGRMPDRRGALAFLRAGRLSVVPHRGGDRRAAVLDRGLRGDRRPVRPRGLLAAAARDPASRSRAGCHGERDEAQALAGRAAALWRRGWHGPVALPGRGRAGGAELQHRPARRSAAAVFFAAAVVLFCPGALVAARLARCRDLRRARARGRQLWQSTLAEWEAKAGPHRFDDKRAELEKLKDWWDERRRPAAAARPHRGRHPQRVRRAAADRQPDPVRPHARCARTPRRPTSSCCRPSSTSRRCSKEGSSLLDLMTIAAERTQSTSSGSR